MYYLESGDDTQLPKLPVSIAEFKLQDNILVRDTYLTSKYDPKRLVTQIVVPKTIIPTILTLLHDSIHGGHQGKEKCLLQARLEYYWPTMRKDINTHIDKCQSCAEFKGTVGKNVPILNYPTPGVTKLFS